MNNLLVINEFMSGNGRILTGRDLETDRIYHLEPLTLRRGGRELRNLQNSISERQIPGVSGNTLGILPVYGLFYHQQNILIGWENRGGVNFWDGFANRLRPKGEEALRQFFRDFLPLIAAYQFFHRRGMIVGAPPWERICHDCHGYYFPDPVLLSYLKKADVHLFPGLIECLPPEVYRGNVPGPAGDLFYLGVFIYVALVGENPFRLVQGWPTEALRSGDFIPLRVKRPDINRNLADCIDRMLSPTPEYRPTAENLADQWLKWNDQDSFCSNGREYADTIQENKKYFRKRWFKIIKDKAAACRKPLVITILLGLFLKIFWGWTGERLFISPLEATRRFYQTVSTATAVLSPQETGLIPDFVNEKAARSRAVQAILSRPLGEIKKVRLIQQKSRNATVEADLICWHWNGAGWDRVDRRKRIELIKNGRQWEIRKQINCKRILR